MAVNFLKFMSEPNYRTRICYSKSKTKRNFGVSQRHAILIKEQG
jgi:hypothetical protein